MSHSTNITRIKAIYNALGELNEKVVFVGGATVSLYAERAAEDVRPTDDVDILVEVGSRWDYAALESLLRKKGFQHDTSAHFACRYLLPGFIVDVMPTDEKILGFSNRWYQAGFDSAVLYRIDDLHTVKIFSPPYFIASKLEAFKNRGNNDGRTSSDFEDIIFVLENRPAIWEEIQATDTSLHSYLHDEINNLYHNPYIEEWIAANSNSYSPPSYYYILQKMKNFLGKV